MKKAIFIIPYFGKLPYYYDVWAKTAGANNDFCFWILTDDSEISSQYDNIKITHMSFEELKEKIQGVFDFPIGLTSPRKLCDFKPTYGYVFESEIKEYQYWGYCDIDVVLGDLNSTIPIEDGYDKLFVHGHMTLLKNTPDINRMFMSTLDECSETYREILSDTDNRIFDETSDGLNINLIAKKCGAKLYFDYNIADITPYSYLFKRSLYDYGCPTKQGRSAKSEDISKQIFCWENGKLLRYALNGQGELVTEEFRYFHFQKRDMKIENILKDNSFLIVPNAMISFDREVTKDIIKKYTKDKLIYPQYYKLKWKNLKKKLRRIVS